MNLEHCFTVSMAAHNCQSSKCPPLAGTQAQRRALHQLRYQLHSVEGRAKCPTVSRHPELVTDTPAAGQGSK